jgi:hypothetical protein
MFDQKGGQTTDYRAMKERIKEGLANKKISRKSAPNKVY